LESSVAFAISARYALNPGAPVFTLRHSAKCYPAASKSGGTSHLAVIGTAQFWKKNMNLVAELERLADALESEASDPAQISFASLAQRIAQNLSVRPDEVAILGVSNRWRHLHFVVPEALKNVGFIPLSSKSALAARTTRDSRPEIINDFTSVKHASVFEGVKFSPEAGELIQKIISAPILSGDRVVGVIQVSRKGANVKAAGPDFTSDDLGKVLALCKPLGKLLQRAISE
jgi:GAF domain-containing protein